MSNEALENLLHEDRTFPPDPAFAGVATSRAIKSSLIGMQRPLSSSSRQTRPRTDNSIDSSNPAGIEIGTDQTTVPSCSSTVSPS